MIDCADLIKKWNFGAVLREDRPELWALTYDLLSFRPVSYLESFIDYQLLYQRGQGGNWQDLSCVLHSNGEPVGVWPLTICEKNGVVLISSHGMPIKPPLFIKECSQLTIKKLTASCLNLINRLAISFDIKKLTSELQFSGQFDCTDWEMMSMRQGSSCLVDYELYVDLNLSLSQIKSHFRKSFRSLVTSGQSNWDVNILRAPGNDFIWREFQSLHAAVAGRITRSLDSWNQQHEALKKGEAFLIFLRDFNGNMVGAGYFMCSIDEGFYAVGAYDRSLFDKPLGHVVQYIAIEELKRRGCRWYRVGNRCFPGNHSQPTDKELSIAYFKEGFSTNVFRSVLINHLVI